MNQLQRYTHAAPTKCMEAAMAIGKAALNSTDIDSNEEQPIKRKKQNNIENCDESEKENQTSKKGNVVYNITIG